MPENAGPAFRTTGACGGEEVELPWESHDLVDRPRVDRREAGPPNHLDGAAPLEAGERSVAEAVMECLARGCAISEADIAAMLADDDELG